MTKSMDEMIDEIKDTEKKAYTRTKPNDFCDECRGYGEELIDTIDSINRYSGWNSYKILEELRADNDQLRALGKFWYQKCRELASMQSKDTE